MGSMREAQRQATASIALVGARLERGGYRPSSSSRLIGLAGTALIYAAVLAGLFLTISATFIKKAPAALTVVEFSPPASPHETPPQEKEAPRPVEKHETVPDPVTVKPVEPTMIPIAPVTVTIPPAMSKTADPALREPETTAPKTAPAPPAPEVTSKGPATWEGRVLAQLNKHRRYPRMAMARRQQGAPYIRFVMDREGKVLSVRLERSSGFPDLDREALALPKRAQPLPKPPAEVSGQTIELVVPVEFFIR